jgi:hypothetical protein
VRGSRIPEREPIPLFIQTTDFWDQAAVDVALAIANDARVQGAGADLEVAGTLRAEGAGEAVADRRHRYDPRQLSLPRAHVRGRAGPGELRGAPTDPTLDVRAITGCETSWCTRW